MRLPSCQRRRPLPKQNHSSVDMAVDPQYHRSTFGAIAQLIKQFLGSISIRLTWKTDEHCPKPREKAARALAAGYRTWSRERRAMEKATAQARSTNESGRTRTNGIRASLQRSIFFYIRYPSGVSLAAIWFDIHERHCSAGILSKSRRNAFVSDGGLTSCIV